MLRQPSLGTWTRNGEGGGTIWWGGLLLNINILATEGVRYFMQLLSGIGQRPGIGPTPTTSSGCVERINQNQNILHTWLTPVHLTLTALYSVWYYLCLIFCFVFFFFPNWYLSYVWPLSSPWSMCLRYLPIALKGSEKTTVWQHDVSLCGRTVLPRTRLSTVRRDLLFMARC